MSFGQFFVVVKLYYVNKENGKIVFLREFMRERVYYLITVDTENIVNIHSIIKISPRMQMVQVVSYQIELNFYENLH